MIKFCDLFAGLGGFREGFERGLDELNIEHKCILTAEIKKSAKTVYQDKYKSDNMTMDDFVNIRDLTDEYLKDLDLDVLLGGFVCKSFSKAGNRKGLECDINGDLFFQIVRVLENAKPNRFILENVDNLVIHDKHISTHTITKNGIDIEIGNTFKIIIDTLETLGYSLSWAVLNNKDFGMPQNRKRIFITGVRNDSEFKKDIDLQFTPNIKVFKDIQEFGLDCIQNNFTQQLLKTYNTDFLIGKKINDKRGKSNNIHTWDFSLFGDISSDEKIILTVIMENRRKKKYRDKYNLSNDGVPLTFDDIQELFPLETTNKLKSWIDNLLLMKYLKIRTIKEHTGYDIISGRLQFYFNNFINPDGFTLTLTATDAKKNGVIDGGGVRHLSDKELCDLFGFNHNLISSLQLVNTNNKFDLFGNSLGVNIVYEITKRLMN